MERRGQIRATTQVGHVKEVPTHPITFEEFLDWCDSETRAEWVNGEVVLMSPASSPHQRIGSFLETVLRLYVERHRLGEIIRAPFLMHLKGPKSAREPDLLFIAWERAALVKHTYLDGPADVAVEIVSPESIKRDREQKMREYERAGVREYWLVDPLEQTAEFYEPGHDGLYRSVPLDAGVFRSRAINGFYLRVEWLWQLPELRTVDVLRELGLV
jgi:Uma2 family endonuclease